MNEFEAELRSLIGKTVCVWAGFNEKRNSYDTAISVQGKLEQHPEDKECFRVVADNNNYAYFEDADVISLTIVPTEISGAVAVIKIKIPKKVN